VNKTIGDPKYSRKVATMMNDPIAQQTMTNRIKINSMAERNRASLPQTTASKPLPPLFGIGAHGEYVTHDQDYKKQVRDERANISRITGNIDARAQRTNPIYWAQEDTFAKMSPESKHDYINRMGSRLDSLPDSSREILGTGLGQADQKRLETLPKRNIVPPSRLSNIGGRASAYEFN